MVSVSRVRLPPFASFVHYPRDVFYLFFLCGRERASLHFFADTNWCTTLRSNLSLSLSLSLSLCVCVCVCVSVAHTASERERERQKEKKSSQTTKNDDDAFCAKRRTEATVGTREFLLDDAKRPPPKKRRRDETLEHPLLRFCARRRSDFRRRVETNGEQRRAWRNRDVFCDGERTRAFSSLEERNAKEARDFSKRRRRDEEKGVRLGRRRAQRRIPVASKNMLRRRPQTERVSFFQKHDPVFTMHVIFQSKRHDDY